MRLDIALVEKGFFETRSRAKDAILSGIIFYGKKQIIKPAFDVENMDEISICGDVMPYVSRGGLKLEKALHVFNITLDGRNMVDIGSSTGGFSDCALKNGIGHIVAIDTGTDQMHKSLRRNEKIDLYEQTDFRTIDDATVAQVDIATIDVSFISVLKLLDKLKTLPNLRDIICLIKPQFECGPVISEKYRGVILNPDVHFDVIKNTLKGFENAGFGLYGFTFSPIRGGSGNIEYLAHFVRDVEPQEFDVRKIINDAFNA